MGKPRVYISGPYSSSPVENTNRAMSVWHELVEFGFAPFCPHLSHYLHAVKPLTHEQWLEQDFAWVPLCHAVLRLPGASPGADLEVELAESCDIPVFHSVEELVAWAEQ